MGGADFVNVLFSEFLIFDPDAPTWSGRDRFFMDPGHMSPMLYAQLALLGRYSMEELQQFRRGVALRLGILRSMSCVV